MGLFEKKYCDLCGDKVNALTRQKLSDGYLCSDCKHKLSSLSSEIFGICSVGKCRYKRKACCRF